MMKNKSFKRIFSITCWILFYSCSSNISNNDALIQLVETKNNFGKLTYKQEAEYIFEFTNPGKTPLVISNVETSCGCTAANWTKEPVKPGKSGQIMIKYDADSPGIFHKTIKVHYNGKDSPAILKIKGQVTYPEDLEDSVK
jgi:hypothetical protein